jgi:porin
VKKPWHVTGRVAAACLTVMLASIGSAHSETALPRQQAEGRDSLAGAESGVTASADLEGLWIGGAETTSPRERGDSRDSLAGAGSAVTASATLTGLWIGGVSGGRCSGGVFNALGMFSADADLGRLVGAGGTRAHGSLALIRGCSASAKYVGDALVVSNVEGLPGLRLYEAWIERDFAGDVLSIRGGVVAADGEFCAVDCAAPFTNSAFGWSAGIAANVVNGGPVYFAPALGARVAVKPMGGWSLLAGAWDGDSFDSPEGDPLANEHGLHLHLSPSQGSFWIAELQHAWNDGEGDTGRPGGWKLGAWRHTAEFDDLRFDDAGLPTAVSGGEPARHRGNQGAYGLVEHRLWPAAGEGAGLSAWVRAAVAPSDRSELSRVIDGGLAWTGPWGRRPDDVLGIALVDAAVSPSVVHAALDVLAAGGEPGPLPDGERTAEFAYQCRASQRLAVTLGLQWVRHPGASATIPNALVPEMRITFE